MIVTGIKTQSRNKDRVNILIDGKYQLSLDVSQLADYRLKVGLILNEVELSELLQASKFGKLYNRTLEYCIVRPRSLREVSDYLYRKMQPKKNKTGFLKSYYSKNLTDAVINLLKDKGYVDDYKFAEFWINNRFIKKGISQRRLKAELIKKGVDTNIIEQVLSSSGRDDLEELKKIIAKKAKSYPDKFKLLNYLVRQGFSYDDVATILGEFED